MLRLAFLALLATSACHTTPARAELEPTARSQWARAPEPARGATGLLDLGGLEGNAWAGVLGFSSDYESDPKFAGGVLVRAPSPLLSRGLLGMKRDDLGIYLQAGAGSLDRDLDTTDDTQGAVLLGTLGVDYTLLRDERWLFLAQAGLQYVGITDVSSADDGFGFVLGGMGGFALHDRLWLTVNPQFILGDGGDYLYLLGFGLHFAF